MYRASTVLFFFLFFAFNCYSSLNSKLMNSMEMYYFSQNTAPHPLLIKALSHVSSLKFALDLGAGTGKEVNLLLDKKFK